MRITNFQPRNFHSSCSFLIHNLLKFENNILLEKVLLISKATNNLIPQVFNKVLTLCSYIHNYETAYSTTGKFFKPSFQATSNGKTSITVSAINSWNIPQTTFSDVMLKKLTSHKMKVLLTKKCIVNY